MPNQFTEVTTTGYGGRIMGSIKGVVFGLLLFVISFIFLYWNEGRIDLSSIAKTATEINSTQISNDPTLSGKFISTTGVVNSTQTIGDNLFLNPDKFIAIERQSDMYSWKEEAKSNSKTNIGGSETTKTTYTYSKGWEKNPEPASNFKYPKGHENPQKSLSDSTNKATIATVGVYKFNPQNVILPNFSKFSLNSQNTTLSDGAILANDSYIFIKKSTDGTFNSPQIGDLRVSYQVLSPGFNGTIFGRLNGGKIDPYLENNGDNFYRLFIGTRDQGITALHSEYTTLLWIFRLVGFLLMWLGLSLLFGPVSVLLDFLPIFGSISRLIIGLATFVFALALTIVTIIVSILAHSITALLVALVVAVGAGVSFFAIWKNKRRTSSDATTTTTAPNDTTPPVNQLENYVKEVRAKGMSNDEIRQQLLSVGWSDSEVSDVLV